MAAVLAVWYARSSRLRRLSKVEKRTAWSITLAAPQAGLPPSALAWNLALFGTGALIMRGAGCTINDLWDRDIDKAVGALYAFAVPPRSLKAGADRTKARPLAAGVVSVNEAIGFLGLQLAAGLCVLTQLNQYRYALSCVLGSFSLMTRTASSSVPLRSPSSAFTLS